MRAKVFKLAGYLLPITAVFILSVLLLIILKGFGLNGNLQDILRTLLYIDFTALWYGSIPYILMLGIAFILHSRMKYSGFEYSHLYSPLLFAIIFFLFWMFVFAFTGNPPISFSIYIKTWLLPISLYIAIGGYLYLGLAGLLFLRRYKQG